MEEATCTCCTRENFECPEAMKLWEKFRGAKRQGDMKRLQGISKQMLPHNKSALINIETL